MLRNTHTLKKLALAFIAVVMLFAALSGASCKKESVVSDTSAQGPTPRVATSPSATPVASAQATPAAESTPAIVPTAPVGPVGQAGPTKQDGAKKEAQQTMGNIPMTMTKAKPLMTPEPDPFPPRPTPTVVTKNGKIVQQWQAPADEANLTNPVKSKPDAAKLGHDLYMQKCVDCHGKNGQGNGWMSSGTKRDGKPLPPTNLASQMVQANTDGELFWKITNGKSPMPAHRVRFDDEQRWYIVAYLRTLKK
jgi:mono/diheme cytochrome c family protein